MADINAKLVKQLRDRTGAGMGACKKALVENGGDVDKAEDAMRAAGVKPDQLDRKATEGAVSLAISGDGKGVAIVEMRCETDFAAKSDNFTKLLAAITGTVLDKKPKGVAEAQAIDSIEKGIQEAAAMTIRENVQLSRADYKTLDGDGRIGIYVHHNKQIGVAIGLNTPPSAADKDEVSQLLKDLAMHATAHHPAPVAVDKESVPQDLVAREKAVALKTISEDPKNASKPDDIKEKMVDGKLRKFFEERALLEQKFVKDPNLKISELLQKASKALGGEVSVAWFVRVAVGD